MCRAIFCLLASLALWGQGQYATISGVVKDSTGAVAPGVAVHAVNIATGERLAGLSNGDGNYVLPLLKPGKYRVEAEKTGFKRYQATGIELETGTPVRIDINLDLGTVADSVTVEAAAPLLQSETSSVAAVIDNRTIANMPLVDRRAAQLVRLTGFVVSNGTAGQFSVAGGRGNNAMWMMDGGNAQNIGLGTQTLNVDPPVEALQEFNVAVSNYAAELGRTGGGVIQMTTKSGTNTFHGSAYEYVRNDAFDARSFFSVNKAVLRYNLFGASIGGPVLKNRTFFFYSFEGKRSTEESPLFRNIPTQAEGKGDFSQNRTVIRDPAAAGRAPFPGNIIPTSRFDPVGAQLAAFYPAPNVEGRASGSNNFYALQRNRTPINTHITRIDQNFSENNRVYGRFLANTNSSSFDQIYPVLGSDDIARFQPQTYYNVTSTWFHNFAPTLINEVRGTYDYRTNENRRAGVGTGIAGNLGIPGVDPTDFPRVNVTGYGALGQGAFRQQFPIHGAQLVDHVTKIRGNHTIKAGVEYRFSQNDDLNRPSAGGLFSFNNQATGNAIAALLLGWTQRGQRQETLLLQTRSDTYGAFLQDDWKVTPRLTINIGLRYDLDQPRWEKSDNRQNSFDRAAINPVSGTPGVVTFSGRNGLTKYANNWDRNNFGPRFGFAWRAADRWVIRGGSAIVFTGQYDQATPNIASLGFNLNSDIISPDSGLTPAFLLRNGLPPLRTPTDQDRTPGFGAVRFGSTPTNSVDFIEPTGRRIGYLETFNFNIEHQLRKDLLLEVGYLATLGHKLSVAGAMTINQVRPELMGAGNAQVRRPFAQFSDVQVQAAALGNSNYHGLNIKVDKRPSHGLHFQANYTWSRMIDDVESRNEPGGSAGNGFSNFYDRTQDRGLSGWSLKHRFVFSSVWQLPVGKGGTLDAGNRVLNTVIGGWSAGYIAELRTGFPYGVIEQTNTTNAFSASQRPNVVGNPVLSTSRPKAAQLEQWFNVAAFTAPAQFTFGNAGRTNGHGPGGVSMDLSILKDFPIREAHRIQFRAEILNFINHANFGLPDLSRGSTTFGRISTLAGGNDNRIVQLGLHYRF
ncbi:MAG: TonB-dependent receptor [Acidobacteria bacterium]|nr:TonB-dependent receptor [Acidobacteriota bacterium]